LPILTHCDTARHAVRALGRLRAPPARGIRCGRAVRADRDGREHLSRWLPWAAAQDLDGTLEFIRRTRRQAADDAGFTFAIDGDGAVAGVVGLEPVDRTHRSASVGYWLAEPYQGRGIMTRAVSTLVEHAVSAMDLNRIEIRAAVGNARSRALPQRLGFREEGVLREAERVGDAYLDLVVYSVLASEWRSSAG
jgi:ribosomal-protein-serine acetyltransferase